MIWTATQLEVIRLSEHASVNDNLHFPKKPLPRTLECLVIALMDSGNEAEIHNPKKVNLPETMKKQTLLLGLVASVFSYSAHAAIIAYDGFDGGTVFNGGTGWSGNWSGGINAGSNLTYGGLITTGAGANIVQYWAGESNRSFTTAVTTGTLWLSWVQTVGAAPTDFTQIRIQNGGSRAFVVGQHNDANTFKIYDGDFNVGANTGISITGTHFVAMSVDLATSVVNLYINPTGLGSGAAPSSSVSATWDGPGSISGITGLRSVGPDSNNFAWDEVRVGTTWAAVSPIPEPSSFALAGLAVFGLAGYRRRQA